MTWDRTMMNIDMLLFAEQRSVQHAWAPFHQFFPRQADGRLDDQSIAAGNAFRAQPTMGDRLVQAPRTCTDMYMLSRSSCSWLSSNGEHLLRHALLSVQPQIDRGRAKH